jgi:hypothetical protein
MPRRSRDARCREAPPFTNRARQRYVSLFPPVETPLQTRAGWGTDPPLLAGYTYEGRGQELAHPRRAALASVAQAAEVGARELRRHRVEAARLALTLRSIEGLAEIKNPDASVVKRETEEEWD